MHPFSLSRRALVAAAVGAVFTVTAASAQQPGTRIRGEVTKVDGSQLDLKTRDGTMLHVALDEKARVSALDKASVADIKQDTFIGIAGMPQADGSIQAFSVHIFLPAQRGVVPDRHGPWDARPGSTMTNAYVESVVTGKDGDTLMVKYKDGEKKILVTPQTVIAAAASASKEEIKAGTQLIIFGWDKEADGSVLAKVMYLGRGVKPAM